MNKATRANLARYTAKAHRAQVLDVNARKRNYSKQAYDGSGESTDADEVV